MCANFYSTYLKCSRSSTIHHVLELFFVCVSSSCKVSAVNEVQDYPCVCVLTPHTFVCVRVSSDYLKVSAINEVQDYPLWLPGFDQAETKAALSMFRRVVRTSGRRPWPLKRDELILVGHDTVLS